MDTVLVVHPGLMAKGGAENVCMHGLEALQDRFEVTLLTTHEPDLRELNAFFGTAVRDIDVEIIGGLMRQLERLTENRLAALKMAVLNRALRKGAYVEDHDVLISTFNEFRVPDAVPSVQYIHHPNFDRSLIEGTPGRESPVFTLYDWLVATVAGDVTQNTNVTYLSNSDWMGEQVRAVVGQRPRTIYPPVNPIERQTPWDEREDGFVSIGKIAPRKRILRNIEIVAALRRGGYDVHLHLVGSPLDNPLTDEYYEQVRNRAAETEFVTLEGEVSRERLVELINAHKFGLHGMENEHFGIAIAELISGGAIPFVPASGGQREVVGNVEAVMYGSKAEAVQKIARVLTDDSAREQISRALPDIEARFGRERFKDAFLQVVLEAAGEA